MISSVSEVNAFDYDEWSVVSFNQYAYAIYAE